MLSTIKNLKSYHLESLDGEIGTVKEFYFDDHYWTIRYLVADTGGWLAGRKVLLSPYSLSGINKSVHSVSVNLTKKQIEESPSLDSDLPVSKQFEEDYHGYYQWPYYGSGSSMWGWRPELVHDRMEWQKYSPSVSTWDPNLRSTKEVSGYLIAATDGDMGRVRDFILDDQNWKIRYLVVETNRWWGNKKVIISPDWITRVNWSDATVFLNLTRDAIKHSPVYENDSMINREYETGLYSHYARKAYWLEERAA